jgi:hypothetical protein
MTMADGHRCRNGHVLDDANVGVRRSPFGRAYRVCGQCERKRKLARQREQAALGQPPAPVVMTGARSVCIRVNGPSPVLDWASVEEAQSLPVPCGPRCLGFHVVVSTVDGRWHVTGPRPAPPRLSELYQRPQWDAAVNEPRRWPAPLAFNRPRPRPQPSPPLGPDPDTVGQPTAALDGGCPDEICRPRPHYNSLKQTCVHGHSLDLLNTYERPDGSGRQCRACMRITDRRPERMRRHAERQRLRRQAERQPRCKHGHLITPENIVGRNGWRACSECRRAQDRTPERLERHKLRTREYRRRKREGTTA